jgi:hypothetical protein
MPDLVEPTECRKVPFIRFALHAESTQAPLITFTLTLRGPRTGVLEQRSIVTLPLSR